jgi:hypothetical protein
VDPDREKRVSGDGVVVCIFNSTTPALNRMLLRRILNRATPPDQEGIYLYSNVLKTSQFILFPPKPVRRNLPMWDPLLPLEVV